MLYTNDLEKTVLFEPATRCNRLQIVSGFTDCERIATHVIELVDGHKEGKYKKVKQIDLIVGMYRSVSERKHLLLKNLLKTTLSDNDSPKFNLYYITQNREVHSKVYTWFNGKTPMESFVGSANYSIEAFKRRRECMTDGDPRLTAKYFDSLVGDTVNCLNAQNIRFSRKAVEPDEAFDPDNNDYAYYSRLEPVATITVSLLTTKGEIGYGSSVNWGIRRNGTPRNANQAYIPYNKPDKVPGFFPDRVNPEDRNCPLFRVLTPDGGMFHMRMAQQNNKALHSAESNSILGSWIRSRLGCSSGSFVTKQMLLNYGKTYVTFKKYEDGTYILEF